MFFAGDNPEKSLDIRYSRTVESVLRDQSAHRSVRDPGSAPRRNRHRHSGVGILLRGRPEKREKHGFDTDQVRFYGDRAGDHIRALHRWQHEPGEIIRARVVE